MIKVGVCFLTVSVVYIANGLVTKKNSNGRLSDISDTPTNIKAEVINSTCMRMTWHAPSLEKTRAVLRGYHLFFQETDATGAPVEHEKIYLSDKSVRDCELIVNDLKSNTNYAIQMSVWYGRHGNGEISTKIYAKTPVATISDTPTNIKAEVINSTCMRMTWHAPSLDKMRAVLRGYHLFFQEIDATGAPVEHEKIYLSDKSVRDCELIVNDLKSNTNYAIQMSVWYGRHGNGEISTKIYAKTPMATKLKNVALGKRVIMSSLISGGHKLRGGHFAVDGKLSYASINFAHTDAENSPWLKIDLAGCRLHDVVVKTGPTENSCGTLCGKFKGPGTKGQRVEVYCPVITRGRFVLVMIEGKPSETENMLNLNEVEVFAYV